MASSRQCSRSAGRLTRRGERAVWRAPRLRAATCIAGGQRNQPRDIDDRPDLNAGREWPERDLFDLANSIRLKNSIEEVATFLCRSRREMCTKMAELERTEAFGVLNTQPLTLREAEAIIPICAIGGTTMWPLIPALAINLAQAARPGTNSKPAEWCFDRGQDAQLCEATAAQCDKLQDLTPRLQRARANLHSREKFRSHRASRRHPPNPERQTPTQR